MSKIKKFRKNNWWDEEDQEIYREKRNPKKKKFERALRTRDINFFNDNDDYDD